MIQQRKTRQSRVSPRSVVPFVHPSPVGIDVVVKDLQASLADITWNEKSFGRATEMSMVDSEGKVDIFPKLWVGKGKTELNAIGLAYWDAYTFMTAGDETIIDDSDELSVQVSRPLSLYVWANVSAINKDSEVDLAEQVKVDVIKAIKSTIFTSAASLVIEDTEHDHSQVYEGYSYDVSDKNLYWPYRIFRVNMEATYYLEPSCDKEKIVIATPTNLAAALYAYNIIDLTWTDGTGGTSDSYEIWRAENGGAFSLLGTTTNADSYRDSSITGDSSRYFNYKVRALTGANYSLFGNESGLVTTELRPQLLLDARDVEANIIASDDRSVAILDQSEALAETNVYTSDFSSGVDGMNAINGNNDAPSNAIKGEDNWLRYLGDGLSSSLHGHQRLTFLTVGKSYNIKCKVFIPSGQNANGFVISGAAFYPDWDLTGNGANTSGSVVNVDTTIISNATYLNFIGIVNNSFSAYVFPVDEYIYIKDVVINEIQGSHFTQLTAANRGLVDSATVPTQITYDGVSDYSENTLDIAKFAAMSQGSVVFIADDLIGAQFSLGNTSTSTEWMYIESKRVSTGRTRILFNTALGVRTMTSTSITNVGDVIEWGSTGTSYFCRINGVEDDVIGAPNDGLWLDSVSNSDSMTIGVLTRLTPFFNDTTFKHLSIFSTPLTDAQSLQYANYLIEKHESI